VQTGHQATSGGGAHGAAGVELCHSHTFLGHAIDIWRFELFLTETAEVTVTGIIEHDIDEIGLFSCVEQWSQ